MSRRAIARTVSAAVIGLGVVIPVVAAAAASAAVPAAAAAPGFAAPLLAADSCCRTSVNGLPGQFVPGAAPRTFSVSFTNTGKQLISSLQAVFTMSGNGFAQLNGNQITMKRETGSGSWRGLNISHQNGALVATDARLPLTQPLPPNSSVTLVYELAFSNQAQPTPVQLNVTINGRRVGHRSQMSPLASAGARFSLGALAPPKPKTTPSTQAATSAPPSTTQSAPPVDNGPGGPPITPGDAASDSGGSSLAWIAYVLGALLLLGGVGAIGTLLWRRGPDTIEENWDDDNSTFQRGATTAFPAPSLPAAYPTQQVPVHEVPGARPPGPGFGPPAPPSGYDPHPSPGYGRPPAQGFSRPPAPGYGGDTAPDDHGRHSADPTWRPPG